MNGAGKLQTCACSQRRMVRRDSVQQSTRAKRFSWLRLYLANVIVSHLDRAACIWLGLDLGFRVQGLGQSSNWITCTSERGDILTWLCNGIWSFKGFSLTFGLLNMATRKLCTIIVFFSILLMVIHIRIYHNAHSLYKKLSWREHYKRAGQVDSATG